MLPPRLDPSSQCEVKELRGETAWNSWQELAAHQDMGFAQTQPLAMATAASPAPTPMPAKFKFRVTVDEVLLLARKHNRVCPVPQEWQRIFEALPGKPERLSQPLQGRAWQDTPSLSKRLVLRDQIEWAASAGSLGLLRDLLAALPEEHWHHMGE